MAHFAQVDENNIVTQVIVIDNSDCGGGDFPESEAIGAEFCTNLLGGTWKQTSYNNNFRKNYACIGHTFDESRDAFIPPKPFESWVIDEETCKWVPPLPRPEGGVWFWNEELMMWVESL